MLVSGTLLVENAPMIPVSLALMCAAHADSWLAPPATMAAQISQADLSGEFEVDAVQTVLFEGVLATSHVRLVPVSTVDGSADTVTLILPGGYVEGVFRTNGKSSFPVFVGERLLLTLDQVPVESAVQPADPGQSPARVFNASHAFADSALRAESDRGGLIARDASGRAVILIPCDGRTWHARGSEHDPGDSPADESVVYVSEPDALALDWATAVSEFLYCGSI